MKTLHKIIISSGILLAISLPTQAHDGAGRDGVRERMARQQARIEHGIDKGALTRKEAKQLKRQQRKIRHLARDLRDDGYISKRERRQLHDKLDRVSGRIWKLKHNDRSRLDKPRHRYGYQRLDDHDGHRSRYAYSWHDDHHGHRSRYVDSWHDDHDGDRHRHGDRW